MEGGLISDGVISQDINQASSFWRIREVNIIFLMLIDFLYTLPYVHTVLDIFWNHI